MMSDTGLYLNWIPNTLIADEDEDEDDSEPTLEDDMLVVGKWGYLFFLGLYLVHLPG